MKKWILAMRLWSLTASFIPLSIGAAVAWLHHAVHFQLFLLTLLAGMTAHIGTNLLNMYGDYQHGVDTLESANGESQIINGNLSAEAVRYGGFLAFAVSLALGGVLTWQCGWPVAAIGVIGLFGGYAYTCGRFPYKYHALGPFMVFWLMGPLMALPAYFIQTGVLSWAPVGATLPISCLVANIMHANDIQDIAHDRSAGITTLAMILERERAIKLYVALNLGAYILLGALVALQVVPLSALLPLVLVPILWQTLTLVLADKNSCDDHALARLDLVSARFHLLFGILLLSGILAPVLAKAFNGVLS